MGEVRRLQTDYDRLSLRNDLGLTKPELDQIAKRIAPPPAKVFTPASRSRVPASWIHITIITSSKRTAFYAEMHFADLTCLQGLAATQHVTA